ncbi:DUF262 domain-containing protein [Actinoalloteichus hymeniacidonis]|uniref:GmrSD restriction endonucleases N-terminal domain-containing protein n=1 Tax=Actinoalloteichus hymeniacidonis TaxID=340345 RepID=A0AAC9MZV8_9PSEU|nr:DUF262 domain-containing protein [Actinoalloteichus hymeniacidonis]AOS64770.1 Protein of unknown function DUF262 [Actinoalloteichus hymeniacidonis]MBB5907154.1 hypothetical protein [Actinoalloteichus hymeniacidonis]
MTAANADETVQLIDSVDDAVSSVRTRQLDLSFNELADMYTTGELVVQPEYQRLFRWTEGAQSRFIETLILELPVPPIFLMETEENVYELIDGLQRVSSYLNFRGLLKVGEGDAQQPLKLEDCDIVEELNGHTYESLPPALVRRLKRNFIRAEILRKESDARLRYYMFKRLNSGGEPLEQQEIRNCTIRLLNPDFNDTVIKLSRNDDFKYCISTVAEAQKEKRYDEELVLRFLAFLKRGDEYRHELGEFLTEYMEDASDPDGPSIKTWDPVADPATFEKTFKILRLAAESNEAVGPKVFGSVNASGKIRGQFAVYHFEGFAFGLQGILERLDPSNTEQMKKLGSAIERIKGDRTLREFTGGGKNTAPAYRARVQFFANEIEKDI